MINHDYSGLNRNFYFHKNFSLRPNIAAIFYMWALGKLYLEGKKSGCALGYGSRDGTT